MTCPRYTKACDNLCVELCRWGQELDATDPELNECDFCGAKILPLPYARHQCRDMTLYEPGYGEIDCEPCEQCQPARIARLT